MVAPEVAGINGIRGWLLVLCAVLVLYQPLTLAVELSTALVALPIRGLPLGLMLAARLIVTAIGIAAGLALVGRRPAAVSLTKAALLLSAAMDQFVYATSIMPNNRLPGTTPWYAAASLIFYSVWLAYVFRSKRIRRTYTD